MPRFTVKDWSEHQHYKDRSPPWLKLHKKLLDDYDFQRLPLASKALAPMLWLLASDSVDGTVEGDIGYLSFRLRWDEHDIKLGLTPLIEKGFLINASALLAECMQVATPETETETETESRGQSSETEAKKTVTSAKPPRPKVKVETELQVLSRSVWESYAGSYQDRYGVPPNRNAKINAQVKNYCKSVPAAEAAGLSAWFLRHNATRYVLGGHVFGLLAMDADKLITEYRTGRISTTSQARIADRTAGMGQVWENLIEESKKHEAV